MEEPFNRRGPLMEGYIWGKTTLDGNRPLMKDDIWLTIIFDEDDLWKKATFNRRWPSDGREP